MASHRALTTIASIGIAGFVIAGVAHFADEALPRYHLTWPWLSLVRLCAYVVGIIGFLCVASATPDRPPQIQWRSWFLPPARDIVAFAVFFAAITAAVIWARNTTSQSSSLIQILAKDSDMWWIFVIWQMWREAERKQAMLQGTQTQPNRASLGVC
jgi:hypothetical protein